MNVNFRPTTVKTVVSLIVGIILGILLKLIINCGGCTLEYTKILALKSFISGLLIGTIITYVQWSLLQKKR